MLERYRELLNHNVQFFNYPSVCRRIKQLKFFENLENDGGNDFLNYIKLVFLFPSSHSDWTNIDYFSFGDEFEFESVALPISY